ncbi:hypothetical protein B1812_21565 (plasmid) [Methylocystis bryophila]|uniref:Carrier domain-containing protein n=1 Tax=Methylocystis bryophila TaxID=655015 RepID=A0A1W6N226_9HYPH|nr:hypothetical protein B1812_21565 [Methylocystis bryophila]
MQDIYPLTPLQEGILFHHLMAASGDPYLLPTLLSFDGRERLEAFLVALQAMIARHDILRTAVAWEGLPEPVQVVWRAAPLSVEEASLDPAAGDVAQQLRERFDPRRFRLDVRQAPLLRGFLAYDAPKRRWLLLLLAHHLAMDHTTLEILVEEAQAHLAGEADRLSAPASFRNFVAQARLGVSPAEHEAFFQAMLGDVSEPTAPFGLVDAQGDGSGIDEARLDLAPALARRLRERARALGVSAASLCHQAFAQVLARVSGREDVVFGTVLFGRMQGGAGADRALGMFINTLPVRAQVGAEGVADGARRMHGLLTDLLRHEHASLALAQRCSGVAAPAPLFSALLNFRHSPAPAQAANETSRAWSGIEVLDTQERTNYPLTLSVDDLGEGVRLTAQTQSPLDPNRLCAFMQAALERLVAALETEPNAAARTIDVLPEAERRRILVEWNQTAADYPRDRLLHELFEDRAAQTPAATAVVFEDAQLAYGELNARANQLAHHLRSLGVGPDALVGICVERSLEMVVGLLAILKAGGAYLPLDPDYPRERIGFMLEDAKPRLVLTQARLRDRLPERVNALLLDAHDHTISTLSPDNPVPVAAPHNLAYVIYTSGSTGAPKGVAIAHQQTVAMLSWARETFAPEYLAGMLAATSLGFDLSVFELFLPLCAGGKVFLVNNILELPALCGAGLITLVNTVPSAMVELLRREGVPDSVRIINLAGEALQQSLAQALSSREGVDGIINLYGPTECTTYSSFALISPRDERIPTIGRPIWNTQIYLLDGRMQPVPIGAAGELYIGGAGLARGYLGRADLTAERFLPDPFGGAGARLYRTGDLARHRADGDIEFLGRIDHQVKIRGFRIELGEIEAALSRIAGVREAAVLAREDQPGDKRLVAYVAGREGTTPAAGELRAALQAHLPDYMLPSAFVTLDALPLTANGKVDRKALPAPDLGALQAHRYVAPRTATEAALCRIWAQTLGLERVGVEDNFFELGGHSLLAVTLIERMRQEGLQADVRALFVSPTPAALAAEAGRRAEVLVPPNLIAQGCAAITPEMLPLAQLSQGDIDRVVGRVPGGASNVQDIYPLTPLQEGILFHHLMAASGDPYLLPTLLSFDGRERLEAFLVALQAMIARHDILRTAVAWEGLPEPVQVVWRAAPLSVEEASLDPAAGDVAQQLRERFDPRRFRLDVRQAPLLRGFLAYDAPKRRWLLLLLAHHLAMDHTTLEILVEEAQAHLAGEADRLSAPASFRNFVAQARLGVSPAEHEAFFQAMLGDVSEPTAPFGLVDAQGDGSGIDEARLDLAPALARRLRERARALGVSAASLCHQAFAQVLARVSGREDVVFGTVLFGRMQGGAGADRALGMFINTLPVRAQVGAEGVADGARRMHGLLTDLLRHEHASLALAQRCSGVAAPAPLFSALLNFRHSPAPAQAANETSRAWSGIEVLDTQERTNYPLTLSVDDLGEGVRLTAQTQSPLDPNRLCAFMQAALERLVAALETEPNAAARTIDVLPEAERRRILVEWNQTAADYPRDRLLHELFEDRAAQTPAATAVVFEDAQLAYGELNARANQLAHHLRSLGVGPDALVGICVERSLEMVVGLLAILKAGGAYLPLDPDYPRERIGFMLEDAKPRLVLTQARLRDRLPERVNALLLDAHDHTISTLSPDNPVPVAAPHNLAYVIYTSGSTGAPKGVGVSHGAALSSTLSRHSHYSAQVRGFLLLSSFSFDSSVAGVFWTLSQGGCLCLPTTEELQDPAALACLIERHELTHLLCLPSFYALLLDQDCARLQSLEAAIVAGESCPPSLPPLHRQRLRSAQLYNEYGPTEAAVWSTVAELARQPENEPITIGSPIESVRILILDERQELAPRGVAGELYIGGAGLARGYLGRADLTAERFLPDPFGGAGARLYRTGDLARHRADGDIEFLGRIDHQVKIRGFRIELGEIEAALSRIAGVREAAVLAREDQPGDKRLVAYVAGREGTTPAAGELRAALQAHLPDYMLPSAFVTLDALPLTANGKVDRKALPAPDLGALQAHRYVAPRTATEAALCRIWAQTLGLERVGVEDNFFELGGHSLLAVQVISRIRREFGREVALRSLFAAATIAEFARAMDAAEFEAGEAASPEVRRAEREGSLPLSFAQRRLWFMEQLSPGEASYNVPAALRLLGELNVAAFSLAVNAIVQRHEALRTTFVVRDGVAAQVIAPALELAAPVVDLSGLDQAAQEVEAQRLLSEAARRPFDLAVGPLLRVLVLDLGFRPATGEREHIVAFTLHHIVTDGWSTDVLLREFVTLYEAFAAGRPSPLPDLSIQYADYAVWQRDWLAGAVLDRQLAYWRERLAGAPALNLPTDRPRPAVQDHAGATYGFEVPQRVAEGLARLGRREGATLFMVLLAGFQLLLSRYSGQNDVSVGTPVANRRRVELEGLIGFFVNTLVLRTDLSGDPSFRTLLARVRETALGAQAHQDLPFERLVEEVQPVRDLSRDPLFQVMFVLQNAPMQELTLSGLRAEPVATESGASKFDLTLAVIDTGEGLNASFEYATALFDAGTIERLAGHYCTLLEGIVADPERRLSELPLLGEAERRRILVEWNQTAADYPRDRLLHELFEDRAAQTPAATAVVFEDAQLAYGELNARANQLAHHLRSLGVGPDALVGICVERSLEMVVGLLAILKAGGAYLPLDPDYPRERIGFMLEDAKPRLVLTQARLRDRLPERVNALLLDAHDHTISTLSPDNPVPVAAPHNLAYVIYTSGSTGAPKGVGVSHGGIVNRIAWMQARYELEPSDAVLQKTPSSFDVSVWEFFWPLAVGARLVVAAVGDHRLPQRLAALIEREGVTTLHFVPSMLQAFVSRFALSQFKSLRRVICSGEALPAALARRDAPQLRLHNLYGPTEASVDVTAYDCGAEETTGYAPIGRPIWNTQIYLLDGRMQPVPIGAAGELYIGGAGLARGYLGRADLTAERFLPDPFGGAGARLYRTGDLARHRADGDIEFLGGLIIRSRSAAFASSWARSRRRSPALPGCVRRRCWRARISRATSGWSLMWRAGKGRRRRRGSCGRRCRRICPTTCFRRPS